MRYKKEFRGNKTTRWVSHISWELLLGREPDALNGPGPLNEESYIMFVYLISGKEETCKMLLRFVNYFLVEQLNVMASPKDEFLGKEFKYNK